MSATLFWAVFSTFGSETMPWCIFYTISCCRLTTTKLSLRSRYFDQFYSTFYTDMAIKIISPLWQGLKFTSLHGGWGESTFTCFSWGDFCTLERILLVNLATNLVAKHDCKDTLWSFACACKHVMMTIKPILILISVHLFSHPCIVFLAGLRYRHSY